MIKYVALHFLPGAAGNFLSRCLNLLDNTYVWSKDGVIPSTLEEKLKMLSYRYVDSAIQKEQSWHEFEFLLDPYNKVCPHWDICDNAMAVFLQHPKSANAVKIYAGKDDTAINLYIDPMDSLDWCILNGFNKTSFQRIDWFLAAEKLVNDSSVYKINLTNLINGYNSFIIEFTKLAEYLNQPVTDDIKIALETLYNEWYTTTLQSIDLENYRNDAVKILKRILDCIDK